MLSLISASLILAQSSRISIHEVGSVEKIAKEIARQTGQAIEVRGRVAADVLIIDLDGVSVDEALQRICWATFGKITKDQGRTILAPDSDAGRDAERAYRKAVNARNTAIQAAVKADLLKSKFDDRAAEKYVKAWANIYGVGGTSSGDEVERLRLAAQALPSPDQRLAAGLLTCTDPREWFETSGGVVEFSTATAPRCKPFAQNIDAIVSQYSQESTRLAIASQKDKAAVSIGRVTLLVAQGGLPNIGNVVVRTYGRDGGIQTFSAIPLNSFTTAETPSKELLNAIPADAPTPLSELSKAELVAWDKRDQVSLRQRLQDPEGVDPQGSLAADVWRGVAAYAKKGLVLNLPDRYLVCAPDYKGKMPPLRQALASYWVPGTRVDGNCIVARPPYPRPDWGWQIPRKSLGTLFRRLKSGADQLDTLSEFVHEAGFPRYPVDKMAFFCLAGALDADGTMRSAWEFLCFFGGLPRSEQDAWRTGRGVHLQQTVGRSGQELDRYASSNLVWATDRPGAPYPEPFDVLPAVIPEAWLGCTFEFEQVEVKGVMKDGEEFEYQIPPGQLGRVLRTMADQIKSVLARPSTQASLVFTTIYPGGLKSVTHFILPPQPVVEYGPIELLPKTILDRMNAVK